MNPVAIAPGSAWEATRLREGVLPLHFHAHAAGDSGWNGRGCGETAEDDFVHRELCTGVIDVDADEAAGLIVVEHNAFGNLAAFRAWFVRQIDIERICFRIIIDLHSLKLLSGNAL